MAATFIEPLFVATIPAASRRAQAPGNDRYRSPARLDARPAIGGLATHILHRNSLPDRARELVIIRACARARGAYPYRQHVGIGRGAGLTEAEIAAVGQIRPRGLGTETQMLVEMVDALYRNNDLDDDVWALAQAVLSTEQIMDVILICGFYGLIAAVLNVARTPLEPGSVCLPMQFVE